jgi:DNA-binding transcriptional ArsR family regulator
MSDIFKALADPTRRKVLELLRQQPMTAGELSDRFPLSRPTMSAHFAVLREADLIEPLKIGTTITYQLKLSVLEDALLGFARLFSAGAEQAAPANAAKKAVSKRVRKGAAG